MKQDQASVSASQQLLRRLEISGCTFQEIDMEKGFRKQGGNAMPVTFRRKCSYFAAACFDFNKMPVL